MTPKIKATRVTATGDIKAIGGPAKLWGVVVGDVTAGASGTVYIRDAAAAAASTGTIRWTSGAIAAAGGVRVSDLFAEGIEMPDGIHVHYSTITNVEVIVYWEG
jgi:hypothetical protein